MQTTTRLFSLCLLILGFYSCQPAPEKKQPVDWVNPQIGSVHGRWFFYTPAALPMGMAKLAPTTNAYGSYVGNNAAGTRLIHSCAHLPTVAMSQR